MFTDTQIAIKVAKIFNVLIYRIKSVRIKRLIII